MNELQVDYGVTGKIIYFLVRSSVGAIYNGSSLETYNSVHYSTYPITATEEGSSGFYVATMPGLSAGIYSVVAKLQAGGSPAESDISVGNGNLTWNGTIVINYANIAQIATQTVTCSSGVTVYPAVGSANELAVDSNGRITVNNDRFFKNTAYAKFALLMVDNNGAPKTGLAITSQVAKDGGVFGSTSNSVSELAYGWYLIDLSASDLNADSVILRFSAIGVPDQGCFICTQTT